MKNSQRPVFLNLFQIHLPITGVVSILHRMSGCVLALTLPFIVFTIHYALISEDHFNCMSSCFHKYYLLRGALLVPVLAYTYHALAGARHIVMDFGIGLTRNVAVCTAYGLVLIYAIVAIAIIGVVLWV